MKGIFDPNNNFFKPFGWLVDIVCLSVCWCLGALLMLPFGGITAALYDSVARCLRRGKPGTYSRLWSTFKREFTNGAVLGLFVLLAAMGVNLLHREVFTLADTGSRVWGAVYVVFLAVMVIANGWLAYILPLLSRFELKPGALVSISVRLAAGHIGITFLLGVWTTACIMLVSAVRLTAFFVPCVWALGATLALERIFKPYESEAK